MSHGSLVRLVRDAEDRGMLLSYSVGSNAGGGGGVFLRYVSVVDAEEAVTELRRRGADPYRHMTEVRVPRASCVIQRGHAGPVDGAPWSGADELAQIVRSSMPRPVDRRRARDVAMGVRS